MAHLEFDTAIFAPIERVFDLARSIDFHAISVPGTGERPVAGRMTGLIELGETVTWQARHLGVQQKLTTRITKMERPTCFVDIMVRGAFRSLQHEHYFREENGTTTMTDRMEFESPLGGIGRLFNRIYLTGYMERFLRTRATILKDWAESERWREIPGLVDSARTSK